MKANLRYEWRRISSVRATWILSACVVVVAALIAEVAAWGLSRASAAGATSNEGSGLVVDPSGGVHLSLGVFAIGMAGGLITMILLGIIAAQAFGQDYRHGTIRLTLTLFPRRVPVFLARTIVMMAVTIVVYLLALTVTVLVALVNRNVVDVAFNGTFFLMVLRSVLYLLGFYLIVLALTVLTRVLALGVIIPVVLALIVEPLLVTVLHAYSSAVPGFLKHVDYGLPFTSGQGFVEDANIIRNGVVYLVWVVVLMAVALWSFRKRDA